MQIQILLILLLVLYINKKIKQKTEIKASSLSVRSLNIEYEANV